ncbi:MAG: hypothetical protein WC222_12015 [Parachlamydiales bacterium]|jgi:hypothetical protein
MLDVIASASMSTSATRTRGGPRQNNRGSDSLMWGGASLRSLRLNIKTTQNALQTASCWEKMKETL